MIRFPSASRPRPLSRAECPRRTRDLRFQQPDCADKLKKLDRVAVVGGGLAGLMAARRLVQHGVKVTLYEARKEVGGRVLSNPSFSKGRITEEGAELIGSFHTRWLELAREFGLALISRMDPNLYERECLDVRLTLDKPLSTPEFWTLTKHMDERVLRPLAELAKRTIDDPSRPWLQPNLKAFDKLSVQDALPQHCQISKRGQNPSDERLWKMVEFKLVNDEVGLLDEMNFLGLLCKVRAGQGPRCVEDDDIRPSSSCMTDGYWEELEIFRCADGCQTLATKMAERIQTRHYGPQPATVRKLVAVTRIDLSRSGVTLGLKATRPDGTFVDDKPPVLVAGFSHVIFAIPPSVWSRVKITADGQEADPAKALGGPMHMNDAVKFFSEMKEPFWIGERSFPSRDRGSAPYGGSLRFGQVWEGTDNQMRIGNQRVLLNVFAGPLPATRRVPTRHDFETELPRHYRGYAANLTKRALHSDWPNVPFIKTGYWSPLAGEISRVGEMLTQPFHGRLFFAGEHTQMDFFGYMEGALRSGERAAETLMLQACGKLGQPTADRRPTLARATPARESAAVEREAPGRLERRARIDVLGVAESPFLDRSALAAENAWRPNLAALRAQSPFAGELEQRCRCHESRTETAALAQIDNGAFESDDEGFVEDADLPSAAAPAALIDEAEPADSAEAEEAGDEYAGELQDEVPPWAAAIDPFPAAPTLAFDLKDERLTRAFAPITVSTVTHLCSALVDLTADPATPPYAGLNDNEMIFAGSLPKICAMYAAFALKARVQVFVDAAAANGASVVPPAITREIEKAWKPKLRAMFPTRPAKSFGNAQDVTFPKLDQILSFAPDGKVDFRRATPQLTDAQIDEVGEFGKPRGLFHDWMRSMLRWSNNAAASKCILALGYFHLNGALARAGLFDASAEKGLWLSGDYAKHDWVKTEAERKANSAGRPLAPRWASTQRRRRSNITATAAQVARFMTLLAQNKLLGAAAGSAAAATGAAATTPDEDMRALLKADLGGLGSDANDALIGVGRSPVSVIAKFGRGDDGFDHECALIERIVGGKRLRYVAVGLGSAPKRNRDKHDDLFDLFVLLDDAIVTRNA